MRKQCTFCKVEKNLADFYKEKSRKDGLHPWCKQCHSDRKKSYYKQHKSKILDQQVVYKKNNEQKIKQSSRDRSKRNYLKDPEKQIKRVLDYYKKHPHKNCERSAKHRAMLLRATPPWASDELIAEIYEFAAEFRKSGFNVHVDHIVPLKGKNVCGLHVQQNLRVCLAGVNLSKSNKHDESLYA